MGARIAIDRAKIGEFCRRHRVRRLALFGSVLRDDFRPDSDVDVLVEFEPGHVPGLGFFAMQDELSELLGRRVDLNTSRCLSPHFRDEVEAEAEVLYDQTGQHASPAGHAGSRARGAEPGPGQDAG